MARTAFDPTKPDPTSQDGIEYAGSDNANIKALRDAAAMGCMEGGDLTVTAGTGTAAQPQYLIWKNGSTWLRVAPTWGAGAGTDGNWTAATYELSLTGGPPYDNIGTVTNSFDSSGNLTGTSGGGPSGVLTWVMGLMGKWKKLRTDYDAHAAATGSAVHGLGTVSAQAANNVALTGGTVDATTIGGSTPAEGRFTRASEQFTALGTLGAGASFTLDWSKGGTSLTNNGTNNCSSFSNVPPNTLLGTHFLSVTALDNTTFTPTLDWGLGGKPTLGAGKGADVLITTKDGGTTYHAGIIWRQA